MFDGQRPPSLSSFGRFGIRSLCSLLERIVEHGALRTLDQVAAEVILAASA
jgi:hypothetical protein